MNHTIRNMTLAEKMYSYSQSQQISAQAGCIGYLQADMGSSGWGFYSTWNDRMPGLKTQEFKDELDLIINSFRFSEGTDAFLTNRTALTRYCYDHMEAVYENGREFGVRVDTEKYTYMMRLNPNRGEYNLYCYCYLKESLDKHMKEAERGIRFIDSHYNFKFRIPDGGQIRVVDGMNNSEMQTCRFIDDYHLEAGNGIYHICEFAEILEARGCRVEPACETMPERKGKGKER